MDYSKLVEVYERLDSTSKRLEKTYHMSELLKKTSIDDLEKIILLLQGRLFPQWDDTKIGMSSKLIVKAINKATGKSLKEIENEWKNYGDLGLVAAYLTSKKTQFTLFSVKLTVKKVFENIRKAALISGTGAVDIKLGFIIELLTSAKPLEAKFIVRTVLEEMRVGVGEGQLRDAIVWAYFGDKLCVQYDRGLNSISLDNSQRQKYNGIVELAQHSYDITNEFFAVAKAAKTNGVKGLKEIKLKPGKPIKAMLCQKVSDVEEGFEKVGKPAQIEYKYDGFRLQIHKLRDKIFLFTRRLENVTKRFPEVVKAVKENVSGDNFIIDAEAVGFSPNTGKYLPFQNISQRIKRKYDIEKTAKLFPVELNIFDVIYHDNMNYVKTPLEKRRKILKRIVNEKEKSLVLSKIKITSNSAEAEKFYKEALDSGNEGVILKNLDSLYKPGSRVGGWIKLKPVMESLDVVIVGAEWGEGKRSGWFTSFTVAVIDEDNNFLEIGKVGTGIKELESGGVTFDYLTKQIEPLILLEKGKIVKIKPSIIMELNFEEIQKSPTYSSGYALRFPRLVRLREDRGPKDVSTIEMVKEFYDYQRGR